MLSCELEQDMGLQVLEAITSFMTVSQKPDMYNLVGNPQIVNAPNSSV